MEELRPRAALVSHQAADREVYAGFLFAALDGALPPELQTVQRRQSVGDRLRGRSGAVTAVAVLLGRKAGFRPLGLVLGSSVYHIGAQFSSFNQSMELSVLTQAMYHARELAMTRMRAEAYALGADGVVGVRLRVVGMQWGEHIA